ncbi:uncharacterized protein [Amphiura filiformis]|uniref:uncharacterized protein n=1 Tax=Amphiura filiformis TaxID=82378 RepID=UPI003B20D5C6
MPVAATCTPTTEESTTQPSATQPSPSPTTTHPSPSPATTQPSPSPATTQPSPSPTTSPVASGTEAHELPSRTLTRDIANIEIYASIVAELHKKQGMVQDDVSPIPKSRRWLLGGIRRKFDKLLDEHDTKATNMMCNRLGVCASDQALTNFLKVVEKVDKPLKSLNPKSFTIVSVDNVDSLSPYAAVTADSIGRSWHGTSVMAQQPLPVSQIMGPGEILDLVNVKVFGDGRCFYRCLAVHGCLQLLKCSRNLFGVPLDQNLFDLETVLADGIRSEICDILESSDKQPLCVLYTPDSENQPGHYDLLCQPSHAILSQADSNQQIMKVQSLSDWLSLYSVSHPVTLYDCLKYSNPIGIEENADQSGNEGQVSSADGSVLIHQPVSTDEPTYFVNRPFFKTFIHERRSFDSFQQSISEKLAGANLKSELFLYMLERFSILKHNLSVLLPNLKCKFAMEQPQHCEKSNLAYVQIYNEKADSLDTLTKVLNDLHGKFEVSKRVNHMIIVGDLKTFYYLMKLKLKYGSGLDWVVPYLGDWHVLKNFQEVIMKVFWEAGLKDIAKLRHQSMTYQKLQTCGNFKRTHKFLLQTFEALYIYQLKVFLKQREQKETVCAMTSDEVTKVISGVLNKLEGADADFTNIQEFLASQKELKLQLLPGLIAEFEEWRLSMSAKYNTFAFWDRFLT